MVGDKRHMDDDDDDDGPRESKRQRRPGPGRKVENDWHGSGKIQKFSGAMVNKEDRYRAVKEQKTPDLMSGSRGALTADFVQRLISAMEPLLQENMPATSPATQDGDRAGWTTSRDQFFINLLLEQTSRGRRTEVGFTKDAWKSTFLAFNKRFNLNYTISQLKSRYRRLKTQDRMIKALRNLNGFGWDDELKVVTASEDVWEQYISISSYCSQFLLSLLLNRNVASSTFTECLYYGALFTFDRNTQMRETTKANTFPFMMNVPFYLMEKELKDVEQWLECIMG